MRHLQKIMFIIILLSIISFAKDIERPKLIVGIVIDQMRYNDLYRYYDLYSDGGFKKLINSGINFTNAHFNYIPTNTGPGHATIYTGTTPYYHGIINNDFYDRFSKKTINCVLDESVSSIGSNDDEGKRSPKQLWTTTITDALKLFTNNQSKVISVSIKDRGAILPAGHTADGVYWYNFKTGDFITSTYYRKDLPEWLKKFNESRLVDKLSNQTWNLLLDHKFYEINSPDEVDYENDFFNEGKTSFPHSLKNVKPEEKFYKFAFTPFANELLTELAKTAIDNENLGKNRVPDFLAISYSSTDLIGHTWGNYSFELMDTYLRLDLEIAKLITFLENKIGKNNFLVFLTSDHAAIETPGYLLKNRIPTGELNSKVVADSLMNFTKKKYNSDKIIEHFSSGNIFLNYNYLRENNINRVQVELEISQFLREMFPEIQIINTRTELEKQVASRENPNFILNGWHPSKSADIIYTLRPGYLYRFLQKGTTHGSPYTYDTHIPLLFYGWNIEPKTINEKVFIVDIAPTIATLLKISEPFSSIGKSLIP